jgi:hypothetical protein
MDELEPNEIANQLTDMTKESIKNAIRKIKFKFNKDTTICKWFNTRIMNAIKHKDVLSRKCRKRKGNITLKIKLRKASRRLRSIIKQEKNKFIYKSLKGNNLRRIWRNLNEIIGRKNKSDGIMAVKNEAGELIQDPVLIAERFNNVFIDSVKDIKSNLTESLHPIREISITKSIVLEETSEEEVRDVIASLKNSAPGIDGIKSTHVKTLSEHIAPILVHLINRMISTGKYLDIFKIAIVTPINKSGKRTDVDDYRPVSVLGTFNKIAEKIIHKRLIEFTDGYLKLIYKQQYGYRKKSSTETAALELISQIQMALDKKTKTSLVFMELKKAFDLVDIDKLIHTLNNCGIRGQALNLLEDYLSNRQQVVRINGSISSSKIFSQGVVQGSVLGSWLFLLFYNSIADLQLNGKLFLFADDSILLNIHKNSESVEKTICNDMRRIINYLNGKKLILNAEKTNFMIISPTGTNDETEQIEI